jgi:hypothetical protein
MDPTTYALIGAVVVLAVLVGLVTRNRRDRSLQPVRLGPAWSPAGGGGRGGDVIGAVDVLGEDDRVGHVSQRTGLDEETVATVLLAWDELASVLGHGPLASDHRYRIYDPFDPPVTARSADGRPVVDPARVARDVDTRTSVAEVDARTVLTVLHDEGLDSALDTGPGLDRDVPTAEAERGTGPEAAGDDDVDAAGVGDADPASVRGREAADALGANPPAPGEPSSHVRLATRTAGESRPRDTAGRDARSTSGVDELDAADDELFGGGPAGGDER